MMDIGVDAATTLASLIVSINTATAAVNASSVGTFLLIQNASAAGGTPTPGVPSVALTEAITDAAGPEAMAEYRLVQRLRSPRPP